MILTCTFVRFAYALIPGAEATAAAVVMEYWTTAVSSAVWITIVLAGESWPSSSRGNT